MTNFQTLFRMFVDTSDFQIMQPVCIALRKQIGYLLWAEDMRDFEIEDIRKVPAQWTEWPPLWNRAGELVDLIDSAYLEILAPKYNSFALPDCEEWTVAYEKYEARILKECEDFGKGWVNKTEDEKYVLKRLQRRLKQVFGGLFAGEQDLPQVGRWPLLCPSWIYELNTMLAPIDNYLTDVSILSLDES